MVFTKLHSSSAFATFYCTVAEDINLAYSFLFIQIKKMTQFNKGPAYGLSAEVKSKVSRLFFFSFVNEKAFYTNSSFVERSFN